MVAATWLARRDGDQWTPDDQSALQTWLEEDALHRVAFLRLDAVWGHAARLKILHMDTTPDMVPPRGAWASSPFFEQCPSDTAGTSTSSLARRSRWPSRRHWLVGGMAAALIVTTVFIGAWFWSAGSMVHHGQWQTAIGRRQVVHLADGSTVTLAGASHIRTSLGHDQRSVELLHGEAFFTVVHDNARPFVVRAGDYRIVDVGTQFDVRRIGEDKMRVVVARGMVRLQPDNKTGQPATDLSAGSVALIDGHTVTVRNLSKRRVQAYLGWRNGFVVFDGTPLFKAVAEFNRYNKRQIVIGDPALDKLRIGGHFRLDNSVAFVRLVQQMFPIHVQHRRGRIVLLHRGDKTVAH